MTKKGKPSSVVPPSSSRVMLAWSNVARICRSLWKRRMRSSVIQPAADHLQSDQFLEGIVRARGQIDVPHPAMADLPHHPVRSDSAAFVDSFVEPFEDLHRVRKSGGTCEATVLMQGQQRVDFAPQLVIIAARRVEKRR